MNKMWITFFKNVCQYMYLLPPGQRGFLFIHVLDPLLLHNFPFPFHLIVLWCVLEGTSVKNDIKSIKTESWFLNIRTNDIPGNMISFNVLARILIKTVIYIHVVSEVGIFVIIIKIKVHIHVFDFSLNAMDPYMRWVHPFFQSGL